MTQITIVEFKHAPKGEKFNRLFEIRADGRHIGTIGRVCDNDEAEDELFSDVLTAIQNLQAKGNP